MQIFTEKPPDPPEEILVVFIFVGVLVVSSDHTPNTLSLVSATCVVSCSEIPSALRLTHQRNDAQQLRCNAYPAMLAGVNFKYFPLDFDFFGASLYCVDFAW